MVEYYKTTLIDITKPSSAVSKVENPMTQVLDKTTISTFDEGYSVTPVDGAISTTMELKNWGKSKGVVTVSYDTKNSDEIISKVVVVPAGQTKSVPLLKNTTFVHIEFKTESIDQPGVSAKIDMKITSEVLQPNPNTTYRKYATPGKPTKNGIIQYFSK